MKKVINPSVKEIVLDDVIGLDTEFTTLDTKEANLVILSIANPKSKIIYGFDFNSNIYTDEEKKGIIEKIKHCSIVLAHNSKVDIGVIYSNTGILLRNFWCTMMASQLIDNGLGIPQKKESLKGTEFEGIDNVQYTENMIGGIKLMASPHSLVGCLKRYLNIKLIDSIDKKRLQRSFINMEKGKIPNKEQMEYACEDVHYLYDLYLIQLKHIKERELESQVKLENKLTPVLVKMEHRGCLIDKEKHKNNIKKWEKQLYETELKLDEIIRELSKDNIKVRGGVFTNLRKKEKLLQTALFEGFEKEVKNENINNVNYSSTKQLRELFERLEEPLPKDDANKVSFAEEPLKNYLTSYSTSKLKTFVELILKYREYSKLLSTYGANLLRLLDKNGRIRTNYTQCFTDTGRLTSSAVIKDELGLNLANIPKNPDCRAIFIPDDGYLFIDSDMTGQELVTVADYSKEPVLMKAFQEGFDHHSFLASVSYSNIFGEKTEIENSQKEIKIGNFTYKSKKLRDDHKAALFSKIYLGGPKRIQNILNEYLCNHITPNKRFKIAEKISEDLDNTLPELIKFLKSKVNDVKEKGYVTTTKLGRRRYFDNPENAYGDAANFDIQGTGAMSIKLSLILIDKWFEDKSKELNIKEEELGWITMSIYDQNLISLNKKYIELASEIQNIMAYSLTFFLTTLQGSSDLNIREYWGK